MYWLSWKKRVSLKSLNICELKSVNWHIQWNEHLALELSYDLGLGCTHLFFNSIDYDSSYPWIRLTFVHLMGVRPVQTYYWKTYVSISLPNPTSDNAMNMSIGFLSGFLLVWPQSLERAKNRFFELVRGCVTIFTEKSRILSLLCIICENLSFPSLTVYTEQKSLILGWWEVAWLYFVKNLASSSYFG